MSHSPVEFFLLITSPVGNHDSHVSSSLSALKRETGFFVDSTPRNSQSEGHGLDPTLILVLNALYPSTQQCVSAWHNSGGKIVSSKGTRDRPLSFLLGKWA